MVLTVIRAEGEGAPDVRRKERQGSKLVEPSCRMISSTSVTDKVLLI